MIRTRVVLAIGVFVSIVVACNDGPAPSPRTVASIVIVPNDTTVLPGWNYTLAVTALGPDGGVIAVPVTFLFSVDTEDIATVDAAGRVSPLSAGTATITVRVNEGAVSTTATAVVRVGRDIGT